ncbi:hypothetical protein M2139_001900 [Enterococcus sp. PF1-24]|uniref:hypothetical protein n=1 Tax=unclassified Enterococcus TaxID=2608891 RepID=UPI002472EDA2|nr:MULTISPECIES: hypothetical protein [unclassified Enterococcus]MDH6364899.1 hypothetical protein [Enterococcus sp. PFB1-1]MDH6402000.1 hypothetical protein [Enterococcus sp. PF1-24]
MKKGLIITLGEQPFNSLQWAQQDQNYLPRLKNYLQLNYPDYTWESQPFYKLQASDDFEAVAVTPIAQLHLRKVQAWFPDIRLISVPQEDFMRMMAAKGAVMGCTTGYVLNDAPVMISQKQLAQLGEFSADALRMLMRDQPTIYWNVVPFAELKELLTQKQKNITVALTPRAYSYNKYLAINFPEVKIIKVTPEAFEKKSYQTEWSLLGIGAATWFILLLLVLFR